MKNPSQNEIEVRWKGAHLVARGWPATFSVVGAIVLLVLWAVAEGRGRLW